MVQHFTMADHCIGRKLYIICRTAPFSVILNDPYPGFKVTPFFDAEYPRNGARCI